MQGIESRAVAGVLTAHLSHDHLGIGINVQGTRLQRLCTLQSLKQCNVFSYVVVLAANPAGNSDGPALRALDYYANTRRPRVSQRTAIHVGYKVRHPDLSVVRFPVASTCVRSALCVKEFIPNTCNTEFFLCNTLWKTGFGKTAKSIRVADSSDYNFRFAQDKNVWLHTKPALTFTGTAFNFANVDGRKGWLKLKLSQSEVGRVIRRKG
jgi:hypothetical protein